MATWNGSSFVEEQLWSIVRQSLPPDEIIVVDDCSADTTVDLVHSVLDHWAGDTQVLVNDRQMGVVGTFNRGLVQSTGAVIFLADQDDVWHGAKLSSALSSFEDPAIAAHASDARLIDSAGGPLGKTHWETLGFGRRMRAAFVSDPFRYLMRQNPISGNCLAFRQSVLSAAGLPPAGTIHDYWLLLNAASVGRVSLAEDPLVDYRQHGNNAIGVRQGGLPTQLRQLSAMNRGIWSEWTLFHELDEVLRARGAAPTTADLVSRKLEFLNRREALGDARLRRARDVLHLARSGGYRQFSRGWRSAAADVFAAPKSRR